MSHCEFEPIFVVGMGRSGTTLLSTLLSAHSRIGIPPETQFLKRAAKDGALDGGPARFETFWKDLVAWSRFRDLEIDPRTCRSLLDERNDYSYRSIFWAMLEAFRQKEDKARVGEKSPSHRHYIRTLLNWYPAARVIAIRRDPRAVVASQLKCPWVTIRSRSFREGLFQFNRSSQIVEYAHRWSRTYEREIPGFLSDPRTKLVDYEDLVSDTAAVLGDICAFLDEPFEPQMLERRTGGAKVANATAASQSYGDQWENWVQQHHAKTEKPISTDSLEKWKDQLSSAEIATVESICLAGIDAAGYDFTQPAMRRRFHGAQGKVERLCRAAERQARSVFARSRKKA